MRSDSHTASFLTLLLIAANGTFQNPWASYKEYGPADFLLKAVPEMRRVNTYPLPTAAPDWAAVRAPREALQALWLGHASFLFQACGFNFLTDPVFSERASPVQFIGPCRYTPPPCSPDDLPPVHVVLISHNHYDHVDAGTVAALLEKEAREMERARVGLRPDTGPAADAAASDVTSASAAGAAVPVRPFAGTLWVCPLRVAPLLQSLGVRSDRIVSLDWWEAFVPGSAAPVDRLAGKSEGKSTDAALAQPTIDPAAAAGTLFRAPPTHHIYGPASGPASGSGSDATPPESETAGVPDAPDVIAAAAPLLSDVDASALGSVVNAEPADMALGRPASVAAVDTTPAAALAAARGLPRIVCVPAQHQSARTPWDRNRTLWCGFVVTVPSVPAAPAAPAAPASATAADVRFYFTGDTGYRAVEPGTPPLSEAEASVPRCPAFAAIGERYGPIDLAALPIGAYSPRFIMSSFHASPEDSVDMHKDVRSRRSVGMHWAVFPLTDEPIEEPPRRLAAARSHGGVADEEFVAVLPGAIVGAKAGVYERTNLCPNDDGTGVGGLGSEEKAAAK